MAIKTSAYDSQHQAPRVPEGVRQVRGDLNGQGVRIGIAISRYNAALTGALLTSALEALTEKKCRAEDITVVWVPGSYEIPFALHRLARRGGFDALIGLGVVIQGETAHARLINRQVSLSLAAIAREREIPVIDGVITAENVLQAEKRCLPEQEGRGRYMALAALEMAGVNRLIAGERS